eukprot:3273123-Prymnesium_polylepis.1
MHLARGCGLCGAWCACGVTRDGAHRTREVSTTEHTPHPLSVSELGAAQSSSASNTLSPHSVAAATRGAARDAGASICWLAVHGNGPSRSLACKALRPLSLAAQPQSFARTRLSLAAPWAPSLPVPQSAIHA